MTTSFIKEDYEQLKVADQCKDKCLVCMWHCLFGRGSHILFLYS